MAGMTSFGPERTQIEANLKAMLERMGPGKAQAHPSYLGATPTTPTAATAPAAAPETGIAAPATATAPTTDPMAMYREALERLSGGGTMLESSLADIEAGKKQAIGAGQQALVSSGLGGTTMMAGVPIQAEKGAGRARLAARGQVEQLRLQTLASYAGLAEQAKQATAEREAALKRLQTQIAAQETAATSAQQAEVKRLQMQISATKEPDRGGFDVGMGGGKAFAPNRWDVGGGFDYSGFTNIVSGGGGGSVSGASLSPDIPRTMGSMGPTTAYSQQFPSIYGEAEEQVPNWSGDQQSTGQNYYAGSYDEYMKTHPETYW